LINRGKFSQGRLHNQIDDSGFATDVIAATEPVAATTIASAQQSGSASLDVAGQPRLTVNDTIDHIVNASEAGLAAGASGMVIFKDAAGHQITVPVQGNGIFSADFSALSDGEVLSSIVTTKLRGASQLRRGQFHFAWYSL
jgi:VCBS repeat-containing protein